MKTKWKDSNKNLPGNDREVFITDGTDYFSGKYETLEFGNKRWVIYHNEMKQPKFWIDIPKLPEDVE